MVSDSIASNDSVSENEKRQRIRSYFKKPRLKWAILMLVVGFLFLSSSSTLGLGWLLLLVGGGWLFFELKPTLNAPGDKTIDAWLIHDINYLMQRSLERLNIDKTELIREEPIVIRGPILWETHGIPFKDVAWKNGKDKNVRFSINAITIVHLTMHKLSSYQCDYNFIRGVPLNERDDEFHYRDVVAVSTRDDSTNYTLPNGALIKQAQLFKIAVSSGDSIQTVVNSSELLHFTGGSIPDTGLDAAVKALRKILSEKKI